MGLDFDERRLDSVRASRRGAIATARFSTRILYFETLTRLREIVDELRNDSSVEGLVFETDGDNFLLGADVEYFYEAVVARRVDRIATYSDLGNDLFDAIETLPFPTVAKIDGAAYGGGFELALACSRRVATSGAAFAFPETGLGIFPGWGGIKRLRRRVGAPLAKRVVFTGNAVSAALAKELTIVDEIASAERLDAAASRALETARRDGSAAPLKEIPETQARAASFFSRSLKEIFAASESYAAEERRMFDRLTRRSATSLEFAERIFEQAGVLNRPMERRFEDVLTWLVYQMPDAEIGLERARSGKIGRTPFVSKFVF